MTKANSHIPGSRLDSITRRRTGCKTCRKRGKKCDERKPICEACQRLGLECQYSINFVRYNPNLANSCRVVSSSTVLRTPGRENDVRSSRNKHSNKRSSSCRTSWETINARGRFSSLSPSRELICKSSLDIDAFYLKHFEVQVKICLPNTIHSLDLQTITTSYLRYAILCLSASNISNLDVSVDHRKLVKDTRRSVFSSRTNKLHFQHARKYHDLALKHCSIAQQNNLNCDIPTVLVAMILLAYYHHASTDHLQFRRAVWETVRFAWKQQHHLRASPTGRAALQLWHRVSMSHRPSKPPSLCIEGEGLGSHSPNMILPGADNDLYSECLFGMSTDDLIYDILIRTMELRTRLVVFRCTCYTYNLVEESPNAALLSYRVMNEMLGRSNNPVEEMEARSCFAQGHHLTELLQIQRRRLSLWQSMVHINQVPSEKQISPDWKTFSTHRDTMNYLYYNLCQIVFETTTAVKPSSAVDRKGLFSAEPLTNMIYSILQEMFSTIKSLDLNISNLIDIYTFSLTEVLVQLTFSVKSEYVFSQILDVIWPRIEARGRGYENSHIPTHLAKRMIAMMADEWSQKRNVLLYVPAVAEDTPKTMLGDPYEQMNLVAYGLHPEAGFFIEKMPLT